MDEPRCEADLLPFVADVLARLDGNQMEYYIERAAIIEYQAGQPRALAEAMAVLETLKRWPSLLTGLAVLEVERQGHRQWLLTTDLVAARERVAGIGAVEIAVLNLPDVVRQLYGGLAVLVPLT